MPFVSEAQRKLMYAAAAGKKTKADISQATAKKLVAEDEPGKLPEKVSKAAPEGDGSDMAKQLLAQINEMSEKLNQLIDSDQELEDWVDSKIVSAKKDLEDIAGYLSHNEDAQKSIHGSSSTPDRTVTRVDGMAKADDMGDYQKQAQGALDFRNQMKQFRREHGSTIMDIAGGRKIPGERADAYHAARGNLQIGQGVSHADIPPRIPGHLIDRTPKQPQMPALPAAKSMDNKQSLEKSPTGPFNGGRSYFQGFDPDSKNKLSPEEQAKREEERKVAAAREAETVKQLNAKRMEEIKTEQARKEAIQKENARLKSLKEKYGNAKHTEVPESHHMFDELKQHLINDRGMDEQQAHIQAGEVIKNTNSLALIPRKINAIKNGSPLDISNAEIMKMSKEKSQSKKESELQETADRYKTFGQTTKSMEALTNPKSLLQKMDDCMKCMRKSSEEELEKSAKKSKPFHGYNKKKHARSGGLNDSYRKKLNRETGSNLKRPVTKKNVKPGSKAAKRRKSFCARMSGVKGPTSKEGKLTPKGAALKRWRCSKSLNKSESVPLELRAQRVLKSLGSLIKGDVIDFKSRQKNNSTPANTSKPTNLSFEQQQVNKEKHRQLSNERAFKQARIQPKQNDVKFNNWQDVPETDREHFLSINGKTLIHKNHIKNVIDRDRKDIHSTRIVQLNDGSEHSIYYPTIGEMKTHPQTYNFDRWTKQLHLTKPVHNEDGLTVKWVEDTQKSLKSKLLTGAAVIGGLASGAAHASPESDLHSQLSNLNVMGEYHTPKGGSQAVLKEPGQLKADPSHPSVSYSREGGSSSSMGNFYGPDAAKAKQLLQNYDSVNKSFRKSTGVARKLTDKEMEQRRIDKIASRAEYKPKEYKPTSALSPRKTSPWESAWNYKNKEQTPLQEKTQKSEKLVGGKGDHRSVSDFDPMQVKSGKKVEMEHAKDPTIVQEITKDHLSENPKYYSKLKAAGLADELNKAQEVLSKLEKRCWKGYKPVAGKKAYSKGSCEPVGKSQDTTDISAPAMESGKYQGEKLDAHHHNRLGREYKQLALEAHKSGDKYKAASYLDKASYHFSMADKKGYEPPND